MTGVHPCCSSLQPTVDGDVGYLCTKPLGHDGLHGYAGIFWPNPVEVESASWITKDQVRRLGGCHCPCGAQLNISGTEADYLTAVDGFRAAHKHCPRTPRGK